MNVQAQHDALLGLLTMGLEGARGFDLGSLPVGEWSGIVDLASKHSVAPLLRHRLTGATETAIPGEAMARLRDVCRVVAVRNLRAYHDLAEVSAALRKDGISVIVLKGAHLAQTVYGNIALRPMVDLDLLVRQAELKAVAGRLGAMGYTPDRHVCVEAEQAVNHDLPAFRKQGATAIEIHWNIVRPTSPFEIDVEGLWERAHGATLNGVETLVLSPEDILLHLCLHACFHHRFAMGLQPLCDIAATLEHYDETVDWGQFVQRARQWRACRGVFLVFRLARDLLLANVPDHVFDGLDPGDLDSDLAEWAREEVFRREPRRVAMTENVARVLTAGTLRSKVTLLVEHVFPSREFMATRYSMSSSRWLPVYYLTRMWDLVTRYGRTVWRRWRGDEDAVITHDRVSKGNTLADWLSMG